MFAVRQAVTNAIKRAATGLASVSFSRFSVNAQRWLLLIALILFIGGGVVAVQQLEVALDSIAWEYVAFVGLVGVPLTALVNTLEFSLSVRMIGRQAAFSSAFRVSVLATAANLLPIPGGPLVRVQALRRIGGVTKETFSSTVLLGLVWLGLAALAAGTVLLTHELSLVAWVLISAGFISVLAGYSMIATLSEVDRRLRTFVTILAMESAMVLVAAFRLFLVFRSLGLTATMGDALVLGVSGVLASVVGVLPGGLGLREGLAAALAPLIGLSAGLGFAVTALDRVIGILTYAPIAGVLMLKRP